MTRRWSVSGRRGSRRRWRPWMLPSLVGMLMVVGACSSGGDGGGGAVEDSAAPEVPVTTEDGRMLQPAGHVGIWFETEPVDPLDRLVWRSQRYVGQPLDLEPLGKDARTPESVDLPNVCAPEVFDRLETLGMERGPQPDFGLGYVLCSVMGDPGDASVRDFGIFWGTDTSPDHFLGADGVPSLDRTGINVLDRGGFSEISGCIAFGQSDNLELTLFSWLDGLNLSSGCADVVRGYQAVHNSIGGLLVQD